MFPNLEHEVSDGYPARANLLPYPGVSMTMFDLYQIPQYEIILRSLPLLD